VNKQLRRLGLGLLVCYLALFVQMNWVQIVKAGAYNTDPRNDRQVVQDFTRARGTIYTADNQVIARSVPSNDRWAYQREYPLGDLFAGVGGFFSFKYGVDGAEAQFNDVLTGRTSKQRLRGIGDIFNDKVNTGDVYLTLRADVQAAAKKALGDKEGSVVVLDPRSGAILAMWSNPAYDPNTLATHDFAAADAARTALLADPRKPLLMNAYQERYMPGSTFKVLTATAGLETGKVTPATVYPPTKQYVPPLTKIPIQNFGGETCGGPFFDSFKFSCNTAFAQMAVDIGAPDMVRIVNGFGFQQAPPIDLPRPVPSFFGTEKDFVQDTPRLAQSGFGANAVQASPLEMALVASGVANGGTIMTPHVLQEERDADGAVLDKYSAAAWKTPMSPATAATMNQAMVGVVQAGTARCCMKLANGIQAAAKTGTAQLSAPGQPNALCPGSNQCSHAWIVAFAPAEAPRVAIAVMVKATPEVSSGVGATVAGPVARQVLDMVLALPDTFGSTGR
jgi:peptidoglycan glycosyltransferase